jgi:hypothetical protein
LPDQESRLGRLAAPKAHLQGVLASELQRLLPERLLLHSRHSKYSRSGEANISC